MASIIIFFIIILIVLVFLNFIFFGPIISTSDNIKFVQPLTPNSDDDKTRLLSLICDNFTLKDVYQKPIYFLIKQKMVSSVKPIRPPSHSDDSDSRVISDHSGVTITTYKTLIVLAPDYSNRYNVLSSTITKAVHIYFHNFNSDSSEFIKIINNKQAEGTFIALNLPGVSYKPGSFQNITTQDYLYYFSYVLYSLSLIYSEINIYASSTSCTYITWYLYRYPEMHSKITKVVFYSPNIEFFPLEKQISRLALYPFGKKVISLLDQRMFTKDNAEYFDSYQFIHLVGIMGIMRKIKYKLADTVPSLDIYYTSKDQVVDPKATKEFYEKYNGIKAIIDTEYPNHNILPYFEDNA